MSGIWSASNRAVVLALLVGLLIYLSARYWMNPMYVGEPPPDEAPRAAELADRIDPNAADAATLAALPMIGPKRARDIVEYRDSYLRLHPNDRAFKEVDDLANVAGIGPATVESLKAYLVLPPEK